MPKNTKIAPTPSEQEKLLSILYRHGVSRREVEYAIPNLPTLLSSSNTLPSGKVVRLEYAIPGRSCISSGQTINKTIIKANNGRLYDTFNMRGVIGAGGYGVVFVGQDLQTGTLYPLKKCENQDTTHEQATLFKLGIGQAWAQVAEPCGIFYKFDQDFSSVHGYNHETFIIMKYLGESLQDTLLRHRHTPTGPNFINDSFTIAIETAICLTRMHEVYGLAHLDLKPDNMFYRPYLPRGEKVEFGDYASTVRAHKQVLGRHGTPPYTLFDEDYVETKIVAEQRDLRTFYRCLTGVDSLNSCSRYPNELADGVFTSAVLRRYDLYYFMLFDPRTLAVDCELPKALILTAKLIAAQLEVAVDAQFRLLEREGLAVRIIANYIANVKSESQQMKSLIETWARNPDEALEKDYLLLLKLNLLEQAGEVVQDRYLMSLFRNQKLSYEYKTALALLYKRGLFNDSNEKQLDSLNNDALQMFKKAYMMKNWELFSNLLDTDPSLINIEVLNEQYFSVMNTEVKPYFDDNSDAVTVENDAMDDILEWSKLTLFNSSKDFSKHVNNVEHAFKWAAWQHTLMVNPNFLAVMQWLSNFDNSEVVKKITQGFYNQLTDLNLAKIMFHIKDGYALHQLAILFEYEKNITSCIYSTRKSLEGVDLDNFGNIITYEDWLKSASSSQIQELIGYLISARKPPEHLMTLPLQFVHLLVSTASRIHNLNYCINIRSFVNACYKIYKIIDIDFDDIYYLSREVERDDYAACEALALHDEENPCEAEIYEVLEIMRLRYEIAAAFKSQVKYFDKYPSLRYALLNILQVVKENIIYRATGKDIFKIRRALLNIYQELDKLSDAIRLGSLERNLLKMLKTLRNSAYDSSDKFEDFIREFVDTINRFVTTERRIAILVDYDRDRSSSNVANAVSSLFSSGKLVSVARNMERTTDALENSIYELPLFECTRASQTA